MSRATRCVHEFMPIQSLARLRHHTSWRLPDGRYNHAHNHSPPLRKLRAVQAAAQAVAQALTSGGSESTAFASALAQAASKGGCGAVSNVLAREQQSVTPCSAPWLYSCGFAGDITGPPAWTAFQRVDVNKHSSHRSCFAPANWLARTLAVCEDCASLSCTTATQARLAASPCPTEAQASASAQGRGNAVAQVPVRPAGIVLLSRSLVGQHV